MKKPQRFVGTRANRIYNPNAAAARVLIGLAVVTALVLSIVALVLSTRVSTTTVSTGRSDSSGFVISTCTVNNTHCSGSELGFTRYCNNTMNIETCGPCPSNSGLECWNHVATLGADSIVADTCDNSPAVSTTMPCTSFIQGWILICGASSTPATQNKMFLCSGTTWTFFTNFQGSSGATGASGGTGSTGTTGSTGGTGTTGSTGGTGTTGSTGSTGTTGSTGAPGLNGTTPALPRINGYSLHSGGIRIDIDLSIGDPDIHYQRVSVTRGLTTTYAVETPPATLPAFSQYLMSVTISGPFVLQDGDILRHQFYDGPDSGLASLLGEFVVTFRQTCLQRIGFEPELLCWNGTNYCNYPLQLGSITGPIANNLTDVQTYVQGLPGFSNRYVDTNTGCWIKLQAPAKKRKRGAPPVTVIRTGEPLRYMIFDINTDSNVRVNLYFTTPLSPFAGGVYSLQIDWGDGSALLDATGTHGGSGSPDVFRTYGSAGVKRVRLAGRATHFARLSGDSNLMTELLQFGNLETTSMSLASDTNTGSTLVISDPIGPPPSITSLRRFSTRPGPGNFRHFNSSLWNLPNLIDIREAFTRNIMEGFHAPSLVLMGACCQFGVVNGALPRTLSFANGRNLDLSFQTTILNGWNDIGVWNLNGTTSMLATFSSATFTSPMSWSTVHFGGVTNGLSLFTSATFTQGSSGYGPFPVLTNGLSMFANTVNTVHIPNWLSNFDAPLLQNAQGMFQNTNMGQHGLVFSRLGSITNAESMFNFANFGSQCDLRALPAAAIVNAKTFASFSTCTSTMYVPLLWNQTTVAENAFAFINTLGNLTGLYMPLVQNAEQLFAASKFVEPLGSETWHFPSVSNGRGMFLLTSFNLHPLYTDSFGFTSALTTTASMFSLTANWALSGQIINCTCWNMVNVVNMNSMFADIGRAESPGGSVVIDTTGWQVQKVTDMGGLLMDSSGSNLITHIYGMGAWQTSALQNIDFLLWARGAAMTGIDVTNWDTSKVTTAMMYAAWLRAAIVSQVNVTLWNTPLLTVLSSAYARTAAPIPGASTMVTNNVINMDSMFSTSDVAPSITALNLGNVISCSSFIAGARMLQMEYDAILAKWATGSTLAGQTMGQPRSNAYNDLPADLTPAPVAQFYSASATANRNTLLSRGWTLSDGGVN